MTKIAFVSRHCLVDSSNGAAIATREGLKLLAAQGFQCMVFCGTRLDEAGESLIQEQLSRRKIKYQVRKASIGPHSGRLIFLVDGNVPVTLFENASTRGSWFGPEEVKAFLAACDIFLRKNRPDIVITYGGDPVSIAVQRIVKLCGCKTVFWLHNFTYGDRASFQAVDYVIVPSEFSQRYYREKLGLKCHVLPNIVQWQEAEVRGAGCQPAGKVADWQSAPRYVTFINPEADKGVYVFARIARELAARRPEIPLLVTQGRNCGDALKNPALGLAEQIAGDLHSQAGWPHHAQMQPAKAGTPARNITTMPFTPDSGDFYRAVYANTKMLLMPSLWNESFGLVAVEAMLNGIPVLASNRGALPETIGEGGFLFDILARYTPETRDVPMAEEVAPWVETIIRLWDDAAEYDRASRAARERAQAWHPDRLAPLYRDFFSRIARQPGPPLVPREVVK